MAQPSDEPASESSPLMLFYCYARKDQVLRDELDVHLASLHHNKLIISWHDAMIMPGAEWEREIYTRLNTASIILLLVSPDFIHSDYCYGREMRRAIERHLKGEAYVIPILLRPVAWEDTPISALQLLPTNALPVTQWSDRDAAFADIARGIRRVVTTLTEHKRMQEEERQKRLQAESLIERGKALQAQQRFAEALPLSQRATQLAPRSADAWAQLGSVLHELQCYEEAIDASDRALSLDPNLATAWENKGDALRYLLRYEEALDAYDHVLTLNPSSAPVWENKGDVLRHLLRYEEALAAYDHAISLDPKDKNAWRGKGDALHVLIPSGFRTKGSIVPHRKRFIVAMSIVAISVLLGGVLLSNWIINRKPIDRTTASTTFSATQTNTQMPTTPTMGKSTRTVRTTATTQVATTSSTPPGIPAGSQLVINDPLKVNSSQLAWYDNTGSGETFSCKFSGHGYEVMMPANFGGSCLARATNFSNFVYQITMTIRQIGQGYVTNLSDGPVGIVFRSNGFQQSYEFVIDKDGRYSIIKHSNSGWNGIVGYPHDPNPIPSFNTALGQPNTIMLVANGSSFTIYVNGQQVVGPFSDTTYSQGMLGVCAGADNGNPSTVVDFSDMKVWHI